MVHASKHKKTPASSSARTREGTTRKKKWLAVLCRCFVLLVFLGIHVFKSTQVLTFRPDLLYDSTIPGGTPSTAAAVVHASSLNSTTVTGLPILHISRPNPPRKPPYTPGAFIHIGKTGGSTISYQLRYGCHAMVPKPCEGYKNIRNESIMSFLSSYYHVPDFENGKISAEQYQFYIITTRDPLERFISVFTYLHPRNMKARKEHEFPYSRYTLFERVLKCFPTLESFPHYLAMIHFDQNDEKNKSKQADTRTQRERYCSRMAWGLLNYNYTRATHFQFDHRKVLSMFKSDNATLFALRTNHLWEDYVVINTQLGQTDEVATFPHQQVRKQKDETMPVSKTLSEAGRKILCRHLVGEYQAYLSVIDRALNLRLEDRIESLHASQQNCPELNLTLPSLLSSSSTETTKTSTESHLRSWNTFQDEWLSSYWGANNASEEAAYSLL